MQQVGTERRLQASDGARLAFWVSKPDDDRGRAMVLVHGAASNHTRWSEFVEHTSLKESWTLVWPDLRGNGDSALRTRQGIAVWCDDLLEILQAEGFEEALIVGHSMGAQIAMHLAHREPGRVKGMVLIDPVFTQALRGKHALYSRFPGLLGGVAAITSWLNRLGVYRRSIPNRDLRQLDEETREAMSGGEAFEVIAKRYGALGPVLRHMPLANYFRQMGAIVAAPPPLAEITCPALVLLSAGITFADMNVTRQAAAELPDSEIAVLSANHWPLTEAPEETRLAIEAWVMTRWG